MADTDAVLPLLNHMNVKSYIVTPRDRVDFYLDFSTLGQLDNIFFGSRVAADREDVTTLNSKAFLVVEELKYPGDNSDFPINKWCYVYHAKRNKLIAEAFCTNSTGNPLDAAYLVNYNISPPAAVADGNKPSDTSGWLVWALKDHMLQGQALVQGFPVDAQPGDVPSDFRVFVSPWRLSARVVNDLMGDQPRIEQVFIPARGGIGGMLAVGIDPFEWAHDCKTQCYDRALASYNVYMADEERSSKVYIASMLRQWIGKNGPDPLGVANELRPGEPDNFLNQYEADEIKARSNMENAASYLIETCLDGPDFKLVEQTLLDGGLPGAEFLSMIWAAAVCMINQAYPARIFLLKLMDDPARFFRKQIFYDSAPYISWNNFGSHRWLWYSTWINLTEAHGAWLTMKAKQSALSKPPLDRLLIYLEEVGVDLVQNQNATSPSIYKALNQKNKAKVVFNSGKNFSAGFEGLVSVADRSLRISPDQGGILKMDAPEERTLLAGILTTAHGNKWVEYIGTFYTTVKAPLELYNIYLACNSVSGTTGVQRTSKIIGLAGASADAANLLLELTGKTFAEASEKELIWGISKGVQRGLGGAFGFVSGASDMFDMEGQAITAYERGATGESVGASIGAAGGFVTAVGGAVVVVSSIFPQIFSASTIAGFFGSIAAVIGTLLLLLGSIIIYAFKLNPYEQFAQFSYLGKSANASTRFFDWAPAGMPSRSKVGEVRILHALLGNFQLKIVGDDDQRHNRLNAAPAFLEIIPGLLDHTVEIKVNVFLENVHGADKWAAHMTFVENEDTTQIAGDQTLLLKIDQVDFDRQDNLALAKIHIPLRPVGVMDRPGGVFRVFDDIAAGLAITRHVVQVTFRSRLFNAPPFLQTYEIDVLSDDTISSLDPSKRVTS